MSQQLVLEDENTAGFWCTGRTLGATNRPQRHEKSVGSHRTGLLVAGDPPRAAPPLADDPGLLAAAPNCRRQPEHEVAASPSMPINPHRIEVAASPSMRSPPARACPSTLPPVLEVTERVRAGAAIVAAAVVATHDSALAPGSSK
ncbi:hypothetical protein GGTG_04707 [Gaeumannomyces tritici R3-111a-1]|uniref:Uncharacterized protein n=1 Tax=Gaeumannomyces tritici (strain R3-111a-1) TaxID=644352 RepID=J3NTV8_GAET3|nr:hypothetical protein GGTG_04707 [Gaeumannomyces tritici R3-111a-1]EJT79623.1 hypothetical protein GGTG_04707 [Gaeumannomyces tritici R3-111a-1]